jgi:hypothetical protein
MGKKRDAYRTLVGKPEGKRPLGRPRPMLVYNIKMDFKELKWGGYGPVVGTYEHGNEPSGSIKCWELPEQVHNWRLLRKGSAPRS